MKIFSFTIVAGLLLQSSVGFSDTTDCQTKNINIGNKQVVFLNTEDAKPVIGNNDEFLENMTPLNFSLRLLKPTPVTKNQYVDFVNEQTLCWSDGEILTIEQDLTNLYSNLDSIGIDELINRPLNFIKTNGLDEGGAFYTRDNAVIVQNGQIPKETLAHELFHIFTNEHPHSRADLYSLIGFKKRPEGLILPSDLSSRKLINPDAPNADYSIELVSKQGEKLEALPYISSTTALDQISPNAGSFFKYINFSYYAVDTFGTVDLADTNFFELVGQNSGYIIHPEEILADNFSLLLTSDWKAAKSPEVIEKLQNFLLQ